MPTEIIELFQLFKQKAPVREPGHSCPAGQLLPGDRSIFERLLVDRYVADGDAGWKTSASPSMQ
jgi:hypothetical protein